MANTMNSNAAALQNKIFKDIFACMQNPNAYSNEYTMRRNGSASEYYLHVSNQRIINCMNNVNKSSKLISIKQ